MRKDAATTVVSVFQFADAEVRHSIFHVQQPARAYLTMPPNSVSGSMQPHMVFTPAVVHAQRQEGIAELKDEYSEGKVTATFEWVTQSTKRHSFTPSKDAPQTSRTPAVPEGKKFFLAPSLVSC